MTPPYRLVLLALIALSPTSVSAQPVMGVAPPAEPGTRYCLRLEPLTGTLVSTVQCWTRWEWDEQGVDVDREWAKDGVGVINAR